MSAFIVALVFVATGAVVKLTGGDPTMPIVLANLWAATGCIIMEIRRRTK